MLLHSTYYCAYCGEPVETAVDPSAGRRQSYVEDCQVCCRPNILHVSLLEEDDGPVAEIDAEPESDAF